jgi:hypothetical protein
MPIDIEVSADLQEALNLPSCKDIELPKPSIPKIQLPTGGSIQAFTDISKGIPTDCSMSLSLVLQLAPLLGSIECLVKVLALIGPLIDIVDGLTKVPPKPPAEALKKFAEAAVDLKDCLLVPTPVAMIPFVRDILCLILKLLNCVLGQLRTVVNLMGSLAIQLKTAEESGNTELQGMIRCAQENAARSAQHLTASMEPLGGLLKLVEPFMKIAQVDAIQLPALGSDTDIQSLNKTIQAVQGVVDAIQAVVDALGGCPE